jgi:phage terminase Nu1 subunit (DNA packaging protein)
VSEEMINHARVGYHSAQIAEMFGVSKRTVADWVKRGVLPGRVIGGTLIVYRGPVDRILAEATAA